MKCLLILSWLLSHGYQQPEAFGIVSNLYIESRCNPKVFNKHQIGIAQWQKERKQKLIDLGNITQILWSDLFLQLNYLHLEWQNLRPKKLNAHNSSHIAFIFCQKFERPKNSCKDRVKISQTRPWEKEVGK